MAGSPTLAITKQAILALAAAGADAIELGVPFSDPVADGIVNQKAAAIALQQTITLQNILDLVQTVRNIGCTTPIIIFSYFNPILAFGCDKFAQTARTYGIDGVLVVDLPAEEGTEFYASLHSHGLGVILLIAPTTNPQRFQAYKQIAPDFIYYISRCAVTGEQGNIPNNLNAAITKLRNYFSKYKIVVGFGISTPYQAQAVAQVADGVVIGSVLVRTLQTDGLDAFALLARNLIHTIHMV